METERRGGGVGWQRDRDSEWELDLLYGPVTDGLL